MTKNLIALFAVSFAMIYLGYSYNPCPDGAKIVKNPEAMINWCQLTTEGGEEIKHGEWTAFFKNRQLYLRGEYKLGIKHGHWVEWFSNGNKKHEGDYHQGKKIGVWSYWKENGEKISGK